MINWRTTIQDLLESSALHLLFFTRHRWLLGTFVLLLAIALAVFGGWLIAERGALLVLAMLAALGCAIWLLRDMDMGYLSVIGLVTLLPFASLPFSIGFTPTFLDLALLGLFATWLLPYLLGEEHRLVVTPVGGAVFAFAIMAVGSFISGLSHSAFTSYLARHFAELLLSMGLFYLIVNTILDTAHLQRVMRYLILGATAASLLGIVLYFLPETLTVYLLSSLARLGYPAGPGVLRYIRDDPALMRRATSTSVDPNVLGSLLNVTLAMTVPQLFAKRPLLPRWLMLLLMAIIALCLGLTISRGALVGFVVAVLVISVLRYHQLLPWMIIVVIIALLLPWTQNYIAHFVEGVKFQDLSMQMRMGEYKDAFRLIARYPVLGVGFSGAPDLDLYVAVASIYLLIAAQMGLIGLTVFLVIMGMVLFRFWKYRGIVQAMPEVEPLWYGLHAAIMGGLVGGISDHYFFSLDFHHSVTLFWLLVGLATAVTELVVMKNRQRCGGTSEKLALP